MTSTNPIFTIPYLFSQHEVDVSSQIMRILAKINSQKKIAERDRINSRVKIAWNRASPIHFREIPF